MSSTPNQGPSGFDLKAELRRLALARFDIDAAHDTCLMLEDRRSIDGLDWGTQAWGLWTGVVVSYARPFTMGLRLEDPRWSTFSDSNFQAVHDRLLTLRDKLFAHNDPGSWRTVIVFPPSEARPVGTTTEEQSAFNVAAIPQVRELCSFQRERIERRIGEVIAVLCTGETYPPMTMLGLNALPDKL